MPIHDWTRIPPGLFSDLHNAWMTEIRNALNGGVLPADYYAVAEQIAGPFGPDVLTLQVDSESGNGGAGVPAVGQGTLTLTRPRVRFTDEVDMDDYSSRQRTLVIRHGSDDRIIALVEIVSPGNKANRHAIRSFVEKAAEALYRGYHLLILDIQPPTPRDPQGIHGAIWSEIKDDSYVAPPDKPLTLVAYQASSPRRAHIEPVAVGDLLIDMPLFLEPEAHVTVPLEATYQSAYRGVPLRWRRVLEG
jgi:hypothetical protein